MKPVPRLTLFALGFAQFYLIFFMSKYFDFVYEPFYSSTFICVAQLIGFWSVLLPFRGSKIGSWLHFALPPALLAFSWSRNTDHLIVATIFYFLLCAFTIALFQMAILDRFSRAGDRFKNLYAIELIGGAIGIWFWILTSARLGFFGFCLVLLALSLLAFLQDGSRRKKIAYLAMVIFCVGFLGEPEPFMDKRNRTAIINEGKVLHSVWDPNGKLEIVDLHQARGQLLMLFEGGTLHSSIPDGNIDDDTLRNRYLASDSANTWGLDVLLPHKVLSGKPYSAALISAVGGQEVKAAKVFGAGSITAIDINASALALSTGKLRWYNKDLYEGVEVHAKDGRFFIENTDRKFDLIQIYSAHTAAFSGILGATFHPSSLVTSDAVRSYYDHLNEGGILNITQSRFLRLLATFRHAMGEQLDTSLFAIKRDDGTDDMVSLYLKKGAWSVEEISDLRAWLAKDLNRKYLILHDPTATAEENTKFAAVMRDLYADSRFRFAPATDDWPFFRLIENPWKSSRVQSMFALFAFCLGVLAFTRAKAPPAFRLAIVFFALGLFYAFFQNILVFSSQKSLGRADWGLGFSLGCCLVLSALAATLSSIWKRMPSPSFFAAAILVFLILLTGALVFGAPTALILTLMLGALFAQGFIFIQLAARALEHLKWIWWTNGLGFIAGAFLFNFTFMTSGLQWVFAVLGLLYVAFFFSLRSAR